MEVVCQVRPKNKDALFRFITSKKQINCRELTFNFDGNNGTGTIRIKDPSTFRIKRAMKFFKSFFIIDNIKYYN